MERILIVDLTDFFGGGQRFVLSLDAAFRQTGIELYAIVKCQQLYDTLPRGNTYLLGEQGLFDKIRIINDMIKSKHIDKIILNGNAVIYLAPFIRCKKKIAYKHTSNNAFFGIRRLLGPLFLNFSYLFCHKIVLLFAAARKEVFNFNKGKVHIIPNGIPIKEQKYLTKSIDPSKKVIFGVVSRIEGNKGLEWLIKVFIKNFNNNKIELRIAGDGPSLGLLKKMVDFSNVENIILEGFIHDVDQFLGAIDVFILPSKFESFPLSILEAMHAKLPVIATDTGGVSEMVKTNYNGFLVNYSDDLSLARAIETLYVDSKTRIEFGDNSLDLVRNKFNIQTQIFKIQEL